MIVQRWGVEEIEVNAKGAKSGFCRVKVAVRQLGCWGRVFHLVFGRKKMFSLGFQKARSFGQLGGDCLHRSVAYFVFA